MPSRQLRILPDPVLREIAAPVASPDRETLQLIDDMLETMYPAKGIGLAAPQVGVLRRVIVVDVADENRGTNPLMLINPEVVWHSDDPFTYAEGCLSIPGQYADVTRPRQVRVRYMNRQGLTEELEAEDLLSTCIQHEIDHLNGVMFIDHLSALRRDMLMRRYEKSQRRDRTSL